MDPLLMQQVVEDLEEAEYEADNFPGRRFQDDARKNPFVELSDDMFIKLFRVSKELAQYIIEICTPLMPPQTRASSLSAETRVLTALRFFGLGSYQEITGSNVYTYISQTSVSKSIADVSAALTNPAVFNEWVHFPRNIAELRDLRQRFETRYGIPGVVGCIDCTHVAIATPQDDPEYPEYVYVNRKRYHSINVQLVCDENLTILNANARFPGSAHDARIWRESNLSTTLEQIYRHYPDEMFYLVGDAGYPLRPWLQIPLRDPAPETAEGRYNELLLTLRNTIERCNGVLKNRFRCLLKHRVLHYSPTKASAIINACIVLHNMCIHYDVELVEVEDPVNIDYGFINLGAGAGENNNVGQVNPDLQAGRLLQNRVIETYFN